MATFDTVSIDITVVLGTTSMPIHQVLRLGRGAIIELDAGEDDAVSILANNLPVAKGTVVVNGNRIAVEVGELLPRLYISRGGGVRPACEPKGLMTRANSLRAGPGERAAALVPPDPICYTIRRYRGATTDAHLISRTVRPWRNW